MTLLFDSSGNQQDDFIFVFNLLIIAHICFPIFYNFISQFFLSFKEQVDVAGNDWCGGFTFFCLKNS